MKENNNLVTDEDTVFEGGRTYRRTATYRVGEDGTETLVEATSWRVVEDETDHSRPEGHADG